MRVGVVIPVYNRASVILETLCSVRQQSLRPGCLIVVDDGSDDGSAAAVAAWLEDKGACMSGRLVRQFHSGASAARNAGLAQLHGDECDAVAFLDSDDIWPPEFLTCATRMLEADPEAVAAFANALAITPGGVLNNHTVAEKLCADPLSYIFGLHAGVLSCGVLRIAAVQQCRPFDPSLPTGQDVPFLIDLALQGRWVPVSCPPVRQRRDLSGCADIKGNLSELYPNRCMRWAAIYGRELTRLKRVMNRVDIGRIRRYCVARWLDAAEEAAELGQPARALICYTKAFWLAKPAVLRQTTKRPLSDLRFAWRGLKLAPRRGVKYKDLFVALLRRVSCRLAIKSPQTGCERYLYSVHRFQSKTGNFKANTLVCVPPHKPAHAIFGGDELIMLDGRYRAIFELRFRAESSAKRPVAVIDVYENLRRSKVLAERELFNDREFPFQEYLEFNACKGDKIEFRIFWKGDCHLTVYGVVLERVTRANHENAF